MEKVTGANRTAPVKCYSSAFDFCKGIVPSEQSLTKVYERREYWTLSTIENIWLVWVGERDKFYYLTPHKNKIWTTGLKNIHNEKYLNVCFELYFELGVLLSVSSQKCLDFRLILLLSAQAGIMLFSGGGRDEGLYTTLPCNAQHPRSALPLCQLVPRAWCTTNRWK